MAILNEPISQLNRIHTVYGRLLEQAPQALQDFLGAREALHAARDVQYTVDPHKLYAVRNFM